MIHFQCPRDISELDSLAQTNSLVFIAGGITECRNWQKDFVNLSRGRKNVVIVNPRREVYDAEQVSEEEQVAWEYKAIEKCGYIVFWFTPPTLNPITLFEFGKCLMMRQKTVFIGIHPEYAKKRNLTAQINNHINSLNLPTVPNWSPGSSVEELADSVMSYIQRRNHENNN